MSAATKKPSSSASARVPTTDNNHVPAASRTPRASTPTSSASINTTTNATVNGTPTRTRSIRAGTPVSARAAAHRASSSLSISSRVDADARAETVALIEDLKDRLHKADVASEQYRKQGEVLQSRLDEALKEQAKLEERAHENDEQIETLRNEKREAARQMREMEAIYEAERSSMMKEKEEMSNREEEMQTIINRLKETLNQRNAEDEYRSTRQSNNNSPSVESGNFAPPSSIQRSDSRNNSKLLLQKDKLIESLRLELAEAQIKLVESENQGGGRLHEVERLLMEARMANARLMEDNESYQLLLQEKTLHGDFGKGDFNYMGVAANQDALNALEGRSSTGGALTPGTSLADELGSIADESEMGEDPSRRLEAELRAMKDQNKALTLYINKIIERLLQHQEFEHILDQSADTKSSANLQKDLPPPPPSEIPGVGVSLLQRARSIATGTNTAARPKPRPMTMMPAQNSAHSNPETAPSIPISLGRSQSTRRGGRPMSEQFTGAAGIVNAMYKGPEGPLSPTLSNPRNSASFFSGVSTPRVPSSQGAPSAGNFPGMRSETSSVSGDSASAEGTTSSPPRASSGHASVASSEKATTFAGNKPRPLRLVQENAPERVENKRASWMGWASSAWAKKEEPVGESIKE
ncbi:hypothetical protein GQX73_g10222 [Xylaria multiplex]|uniref:M protein, serotype 2.1 n=1 Tax=Xylaria multiplex TaxID=323545 RepID=A0A7C8MII0_9PEZI|nr:hypothetical protein GQX73_g10222 [Xylaria multiplex]